jgi:hypothetical protein
MAAKEQLAINSGITAKGLARLGVQSRQLGSIEILDLFYSFYNPQRAKIQPLTDKTLEMINNSYVKRERKSK